MRAAVRQRVHRVVSCLQFAIDTLTTFGFTQYEAELSTWDNGASGKYDGTADQWQLAENALRKATDRLGMKVAVMTDEAAFYGPKIDFDVTDAIGRKWQCATIQLDYQLPARFSLKYIGADNTEHMPIVIHRAIFGSIERFVAILIEHYAGAWPLWLAPVQAIVLPISDRHLDYARQVHTRLAAAGLRAELDERQEKIGYKIREAQLQKVPYMLVVGDKEIEAKNVSVRHRHAGDLGPQDVAAFGARVVKLTQERAVREEDKGGSTGGVS